MWIEIKIGDDKIDLVSYYSSLEESEKSIINSGYEKNLVDYRDSGEAFVGWDGHIMIYVIDVYKFTQYYNNSKISSFLLSLIRDKNIDDIIINL